MAEIRVGRSYAVLLGDVVASRDERHQERLFRDLEAAHAWLDQRLPAVQPVELTVGDEFQGIYAHVRDALKASVLLRLRLHGRYDLRFGIGWGEISSYDPEKAPSGQSGPAWWNARKAIEEAARLPTGNRWPRTVRTRLELGAPSLDASLNAFALCQDHLLGGMDTKDARITLGLFFEERQEDVARELGISQSSVSRRQVENGPATVVQANQGLEALLP